METRELDYHLPASLIAKRPLSDRSQARLLVLRRDGRMEHRRFVDLPRYLEAGDMLVINNTKVFPARITGVRDDGKVMDVLFVRERSDGTWEVLSKGTYTGRLRIHEDCEVHLSKGSSARFIGSSDPIQLMWKYGSMPLPPYITRPPDEADRQTYQTVYATKEGSVAAPTAGLHFTRDLLDEIARKGVLVQQLTLHVGPGTFRPIRADVMEQHAMEEEYFEIPADLIAKIRSVKASGGRIVAVGTTTTRSLEGYFSGRYRNGSHPSVVLSESTHRRIEDDATAERDHPDAIRGVTDIFIYPGYTFCAIDALVTNFHLPRSTPLALVSALAGTAKILSAYREAVAHGYRFLSYGDAMLIL